MSNDKTKALPHHSHATVREWMPVAEALRLADLWTVGDLDASGQWRAAIKVLADEVRALAAAPQAPQEPVAWAVGWRHTRLRNWNEGKPSDESLRYWAGQGLPIEYAYSR